MTGYYFDALFFLWLRYCSFSGCAPKQEVVYEGKSGPEASGQNSSQGMLQGSGLSDSRYVAALLNIYIRDWQGTPYRFGGLSHRGVDCSGFTLMTYREIFGLQLPRTTKEQAGWGEKVKRAQLNPGDLVFFKTGFRQKHVGIYLQDYQFVHASLSKGVTISSLDDDYWQSHFWQARRPTLRF